MVHKQTENSLYIDQGDLRYNDYYGKALVIYNYANESANVFYRSEAFVHELLYLLILSRSGKGMDRKKLHKIHACGLSKKDKNLIFMMPSKGGKTSLFCEFLKDPTINLISDDTPVIDQQGRVHAFPLRVGVESKDKLLKEIPSLKPEDFITFKREHYSQKELLSLSKLPNKIHVGKKNILVVGKRSTFKEPVLKKIGSFKMLKYTLEHMVLGIGLPMIVEYFLRNTLKDHLINFSIFCSRLIAAIQLVWFADNYECYTCSDQEKNCKILKRLIT